MLFGQQFAFHEGQKWANKKAPKKLKSDCHAAVGKHPALHGFDFGRSKDFHSWDKYVKAVQRMGGISTYSWHAKNPVTGGSAKDKKDNPVASILEKEKYRKIWLEELDKVADVFNNLKVGGKKIPIIFRPFHENTGRWFWWGSPNCTPEQYVELWRLTVDYLRKEKGVDNILMAYSPSKPSQNIELTKAMYPGDEYVDIIGFDAYDSNENLPEILLESARFVCKWAEKTDKVAAITETGISKGLQNSVSSTWFTKEFLEVIKNDSIARNVAFALTWRNSATNSYWIPVKGQKNYEDFVTFSKDDFVVFLDPDKQEAK